MFTRRLGQETVERPPEGSDSCYGVRSLSNSVWSEGGDDANDQVEAGGGDDGNETEFRPTVISTLPIAISQRGQVDEEEGGVQTGSFNSNDTMTPLRPNDHLPRFDAQSMTEGYRRVSLAELPTVPQTPEFDDGPSVPSSPASLAFSCIASLSSLSRTSSPVSGVSGLDQHTIGLGINGEDQDLVVPTLSLPNSSLHMSLRNWDGSVGETMKIGLVGSADHIGDVLRGLQADGLELVYMDQGVGVVNGDRVSGVIVTAATAEEMRRRVNEGYAAFDGLINPSLPSAKEDEIRKLARAYAGKSDWIHTVVVIDSDEASLQILAGIVTVITALKTDAPTFNLRESRTTSARKLGEDPTPMPSISRAESYFAMPTSHHSTLLQRVLDNESRIIDASLTEYLCWRGGDHTPLHSSYTSATSPCPSSFDGSQPMPTVARAQGGAQWEAEISRREANHRRLKHRRRPNAREEYHLDKRRRRTCGPDLFPKGRGFDPHSISSTGLGSLADGVWGYVRNVQGWKWGLAAAAVLFVGLGLDYFKTRW